MYCNNFIEDLSIIIHCGKKADCNCYRKFVTSSFDIPILKRKSMIGRRRIVEENDGVYN